MVEAAGAFAGQHILITGATGGVGSIIASRLAREKCRISAVGRREDRLEDLTEWVEDLGGSCNPINKDMHDLDATEFIVQKATERFGPLDTAILGATKFALGQFAEFDETAIEEIIRVNLLSPIAITRAIIPDMLRRGFGKIAFISSVAGILPLPYMAVYDASKSAIITFTKALAQEIEGSGVTVSCISPRAIDTVIMNQMKPLTVGLGWIIDTPEAVAEQILRATALGKTHVSIGSMEKLVPFLQSVFPNLVKRILNITRYEMDHFFETGENVGK